MPGVNLRNFIVKRNEKILISTVNYLIVNKFLGFDMLFIRHNPILHKKLCRLPRDKLPAKAPEGHDDGFILNACPCVK